MGTVDPELLQISQGLRALTACLLVVGAGSIAMHPAAKKPLKRPSKVQF